MVVASEAGGARCNEWAAALPPPRRRRADAGLGALGLTEAETGGRWLARSARLPGRSGAQEARKARRTASGAMPCRTGGATALLGWRGEAPQ